MGSRRQGNRAADHTAVERVAVFEQITNWVADGATWLIGEVVKEIEQTTTPDLTSKGFLSQYGRRR